MSWNGVGSLIRLDGRVDSAAYQRILEDHMLQDADHMIGDDLLFQQNNAPINSSRSTREWLRAHDVTVLDWPPKSPVAIESTADAPVSEERIRRRTEGARVRRRAAKADGQTQERGRILCCWQQGARKDRRRGRKPQVSNQGLSKTFKPGTCCDYRRFPTKRGTMIKACEHSCATLRIEPSWLTGLNRTGCCSSKETLPDARCASLRL